MENSLLDSILIFHLNTFVEIVELFKKEQASREVEIRQLMAEETRRQVPCQRNNGIRIKAIVDNFDNYTIIDYLTALSY